MLTSACLTIWLLLTLSSLVSLISFALWHPTRKQKVFFFSPTVVRKASKINQNSKKDKYSSNSEESSASYAANFNSDDREKLHEIYSCMKKLESQVHELKAKLNDNNEEMLNLKAENIKLKQALSLNVFNVDALEQYGRRKNLRIHGSP